MYTNDGTIVNGPDGVIMKMDSIKKAEAFVKALTNAYRDGKVDGKIEAENYGATYVDAVASSCHISAELLYSVMQDFDVKFSK